jgi:hypothetical protein
MANNSNSNNIYEATAFRGLANRSHPSLTDLIQERRVEQGFTEVLCQPPSTSIKTSQSAKDLQDLIQSALDVMTTTDDDDEQEEAEEEEEGLLSPLALTLPTSPTLTLPSGSALAPSFMSSSSSNNDINNRDGDDEDNCYRYYENDHSRENEDYPPPPP